MGIPKDLSGKRFNELFALRPIGTKGKSRSIYWLCLCSCKRYTEVSSNNLIGGKVKRCKECGHKLIGEKVRIHGESNNGGDKLTSRTYAAWQNMKTRCYNKNRETWERYGGRGISVCDRWLNSYENFLLDMGECPDGLTLDRIDNNGNYEPGNCQWATRSQQAYNRTIWQNERKN